MKDAARWDERYAKGQTWSIEPNRFFVEALAQHRLDHPAPGSRALDLACGEGRNAIHLALVGYATTAVDFSPVGIERGEKMSRDAGIAVTYVVADLETWPIEPQAWDLIAHVYLHWPSALRTPFFPRVFAGLAPGGTLVMIGHDRTNIEHGVGGPQDPDVLTTPDEFAALCRKEGLEVLQANIVRRPVDAEGGHGPSGVHHDAIDHVIVARRPTSIC